MHIVRRHESAHKHDVNEPVCSPLLGVTCCAGDACRDDVRDTRDGMDVRGEMLLVLLEMATDTCTCI